MQIQGKLLAFAAFFLALPYCLADLVPTSISEQVSGSGHTIYCAQGVNEPCATDSFDFAASNGLLGPYKVFKSGEDDMPTLVTTITSIASAGQTSNVSAANISVDMETDSSIDGQANHIGANTAVSSQFLFLFDLTSPAMVHLTGSAAVAAGNPNGQSSSADAQLLFTGPGFQFERDACPPDTVGGCDGGDLAFDEQFLLNPGIYTFSALTDGNIMSGNPFGGGAYSNANLSVNADFTAAPETVPEPRWVAIILALLVTICCAVTRWRCARPTA